jgi:microcystin-dependent protein
MKKIVSSLLLTLLTMHLYCQNIGIGISTPSEKLNIDSGNVRIGNGVWSTVANSRLLYFGDQNFISIGEEESDDVLSLQAKEFRFRPSASGYSGNVGIGITSSPSAKLHVGTSFRYEDGNQQASKVLISDNFGNATWQNLPTTPPPSLALKVCIALEGIYPNFNSGGVSDFTYIGEIKIFPYANVPSGWMECQGQILPISNNVALFSLIGANYGGDGVTTFALPNLTAKTVIGQ